MILTWPRGLEDWTYMSNYKNRLKRVDKLMPKMGYTHEQAVSDTIGQLNTLLQADHASQEYEQTAAIFEGRTFTDVINYNKKRNGVK